MNLNRFTVFAAVARHRNLTRAAKELRISQPGVTKHLRLLQEDYGVKLYKRAARGIELTEAGKIFFRGVKAIFRQHERLKRKIRAVSPAAEAKFLTVGASLSPSASLLPTLLARFEKRCPDVDIDLRTDNRVAIERMILNGEVDVAVINNAPSSRSLTLEPYRRELMVAFVSRNHPLAKREKPTWQDLGRVSFIIRKPLGSRGTAERLLQLMRKKGLKPKVALRCDSPEAVKAAVERKMGMGLLFKETIEPEVRKGEFKIITLPGQKLEGQSFIAYRKGRPLSSSARAFLELLRQSRRKS